MIGNTLVLLLCICTCTIAVVMQHDGALYVLNYNELLNKTSITNHVIYAVDNNTAVIQCNNIEMDTIKHMTGVNWMHHYDGKYKIKQGITDAIYVTVLDVHCVTQLLLHIPESCTIHIKTTHLILRSCIDVASVVTMLSKSEAVLFIEPVNATPAIYNIVPQAGRSGTVVHVIGVDLCDGVDDIINVSLGTVAVQSVINATSTDVFVVASGANHSDTGPVTIETKSNGVVMSSNVTWTLLTNGAITNIVPRMCTTLGGCSVTLTGTNFIDDLNDVIDVKICNHNTVVVNASTDVLYLLAPENRLLLPCTVTVHSVRHGESNMINGFRYIEAGHISSISPVSGPVDGGNTLTIRGMNMVARMSNSNAFDLVRVVVAGVEQTNIVHANDTAITLSLHPANHARYGAVEVYSVSQVRLDSNVKYYYLPPGIITNVVPNHVSCSCHNDVNITTDHSDNVPGDILSVELAGVKATIKTVTPSSVLVDAAPVPKPVCGDVVVVTKTYGIIVSKNAFCYDNTDASSGWTPLQIVAVIVGAGTATVGTVAAISFQANKIKRKKTRLLMVNTSIHNEDASFGYLTTQ